MRPRVSCLVTTYNYGHLIARAIDSALAQDYGAESLEIIVIDDGSTDGTAEVVAPYLDRVRYVRKENGGLVSSINRGIDEATGEFLAILDADDEWPPDKISRQMALFEGRPELGLVYSDLETIDLDGQVIEPSYFRMLRLTPPRGVIVGPQLTRNYPAGGTMLIRAALTPHFHPIDPALICHDWPIANAVAAVAEIDFVDAPLYRYRQHGQNMNLGNEGEARYRIAHGENVIRRALLARVRPEQATRAELVEAVTVLDRTYREFGERPEDVVVVDDAQRAASRASRLAALEAWRAGDEHVALCRLVNALAYDPLDPAPRAAATALLSGAAPPAAAALETRGMTVLAFADELVARPELLAAYGAAVGPDDDVTLVIYAPGWDAARAAAELPAVLAHAGVDAEHGPDLLALPVAPDTAGAQALADAADALLTEQRHPLPFAAIPAYAVADLQGSDPLRLLRIP